jgi:NTE family protein
MIIDGVFSGGGIKGFALVGAVKVLEERGFIFSRTAGTSAGAIIAAFITAGYNGNEMNDMLNEMDVSELLDARKRNCFPIPFAKWLMIYWKLGLYKGDALEKWVAEKLAARGVVRFSDLPYQSLRIVVSDITNGRLVVLPDDLIKYGIEPDSFPVAKAVRMSCSIPYFFEPVKLKLHKGKRGNVFVDGGVLSNFPMWLFDSENVKKVRPVLGIKLSGQEESKKPHKIDNAVDMFNALFKTMKDAHDARYISRKHVRNIIFIPMKGVSATEFDLTDENKAVLVNQGISSTEKFLKRWTY